MATDLPKDREDIREWHRARAVADRAIRREKQESWRAYASTLDVTSDATKIFQTIKAMDGRRPTTHSMVALHDGERVLTDGRDKAELLAGRYAAVSRLETTDRAADAKLRREIERWLGEGDADRRLGWLAAAVAGLAVLGVLAAAGALSKEVLVVKKRRGVPGRRHRDPSATDSSRDRDRDRAPSPHPSPPSRPHHPGTPRGRRGWSGGRAGS